MAEVKATRAQLVAALEANGGNVTHAARQLGMSRERIYQRVRELREIKAALKRARKGAE